MRAQYSSCITGSVDTLRENRIGAVGVGLDNYVISFRNADAKFIDRYRFDVLAIGGDHLHFQPGDSHIENRHGGGIDKTKPDFLTLFKQAEPAIFRRSAVHQKGIGISGYIRQVAVAHPHPVPHRAVTPRLGQALFLDVSPQIAGSSLTKIVVIALFLQFGVDSFGLLIAPVG